MKLCLLVAALAAVYFTVDAKQSPPKVQVYSRDPGQFGSKNTLICHVSNFHPPDISIQLLKDGVELSGSKQTDLAFKQDWHFHLTKSVDFTPTDAEKYSCRVIHGQGVTRDYAWESNM